MRWNIAGCMLLFTTACASAEAGGKSTAPDRDLEFTTGQPAKSKPSKEKAPPSTRVMSNSSCPAITVVPLYIQKLSAFPACMS